MADWPVRGTHPWDTQLHEAIESRIDGITLDVSHADQALSAANPTVPDLANVNEWTVLGPVQVVLPPADPGSQYTVHVKSGFQDITWPNGTTVYGETDQQDVWVTLIRGVAGWNVLIPSPAAEPGAAGLDTGWVALASGYNFGGEVTWVTPPTEITLSSNWGVATGTIMSIQARRMGNTFYLWIEGLSKLDVDTTGIAFSIPSSFGISVPSNAAYSGLVPTIPGATTYTPHGTARLAYGSANRSIFALATDGTDLPTGTVIGRSGSAPGAALFSFPISPSSAWGT